jgi:hypothetical protein
MASHLIQPEQLKCRGVMMIFVPHSGGYIGTNVYQRVPTHIKRQGRFVVKPSHQNTPTRLQQHAPCHTAPQQTVWRRQSLLNTLKGMAENLASSRPRSTSHIQCESTWYGIQQAPYGACRATQCCGCRRVTLPTDLAKLHIKTWLSVCTTTCITYPVS